MATTPTQDAVPSESPRDVKFNAGKIDEFVTSLALKYADRFGGEHYTIEGLRWLAQQSIAAFGWVPIGTFQEGATLTLPNQILKDEDEGEYYRWDGPLRKEVPAGSTPESAGGIGSGAWLSVGDASLRAALGSNSGAEFIGSGLTVSFDTVADMKSATWISLRMNAITKGYFVAGDGGGATYTIQNEEPSEVGYGSHALQNGLYAHISSGDTAYLEQWGALAQDASEAIQAAVSTMQNIRSIKKREYSITKTIRIPSNRNLNFNGSKVSMPSGSIYRDFFLPDGSEDARNSNITFTDVELAGFYSFGAILDGISWSVENGNGVVGLRMKYCDVFSIRNVESYGFHYGIEVKTSTDGSIEGCRFHDNIDDGLSISDGGVVPIQSSDILVSRCASYKNGYSDNNVGNSGFEVDDGPRNITFFQCLAYDNESRGFACHVHATTTVQCANIRFIECVAKNNNNILQSNPVYDDRGCGFGFSTASTPGNNAARLRDLMVLRCETEGHTRASVYYDCSAGTLTMSGFKVESCRLIDNQASIAGVFVSRVSDVFIEKNIIQPTASIPPIYCYDNRGILEISRNKLGVSQLVPCIRYNSASFAVRANVYGNDISFGAANTDSVIAFPFALSLSIVNNSLRGEVSLATAIFIGSADSSCSDNVVISGNYIEKLSVGVYARGGESLKISDNTFKLISTQVLSRLTTSSSGCSLTGNVYLNCASDGAGGADIASGNIAKTF